MLFTKENINYSTKKSFNNNLRQNLAGLSRDIVLYFTLISLLLKSIAFVWLINSEKGTSFKFGWAFYGDAHLIVYICFITALLSFSFLFKRRAHLWSLIFINLLVTVLIICDLWYYRGFNNFITLHALKQTTNLDNLSSDIVSMMRNIDLIFIIDLVVLIPICIKLRNIYTKQKRAPLFFLILLVFSVSYIWISHYKIDIVDKGQKTILFRICWTPNQTMANLSPIGYHIYDAYNYWEDNKPYNMSPEEKKQIQTWFNDKQENLPDNEYKGLFKGKNLIVIQVESLENFVIGQKINGQEITPNLNKLLKNSLYFNNYHEQVYNGTSSDADLMTNASVYPVRRGSTFFRYPNNTYNSLPKLMQNIGYNTIAIHPDKGSYWNWMPALTSMGFQKTIDASYFNMDETIGLGLSDGSYLKQMEPIIKEQRQPFYSFAVTLTSHGPFDLPNKYRELKLDPMLDETKLGGYFQSIHYVDKHLGTLFDNLEKDGILDNSVLVIYGDHTGIHKYYEDEVEKITPQEDWWQGNDWRIPLIMYQKDLNSETIKTAGGQIDLMPTLAYLMGVNKEDYEQTVMGRNLLNTKKNFAVLASGKYIGDKSSDREEQEAINGLDIADKILRSNYFKNNGK